MSPPRLVIDELLLRELLAELARRGEGHRESGAFLLASRDHPADVLPQPVSAVAFYDDLDPTCLTGGITFQAHGYTALNARCRRDRLRVIGDIHTHPGHRVQQSRIDATHPMAALDGHVALIAPRYGEGVTDTTELGVHLRIDGTWTSRYGSDTTEILQTQRQHIAPWWRRTLSWLHNCATRWRRPWSNR